LANIPSKEELLSKLVRLFNYPVQSLTSVLDQIAKKKAEGAQEEKKPEEVKEEVQEETKEEVQEDNVQEVQETVSTDAESAENPETQEVSE